MIVLYTTERDYPWGTLRSTHASKTKVVLEEKSIPYRIENLPPGNLWKKPPEMLAKHPLGKVPYLEDSELVIFDSTVIDEYLEERYGPPRLMPSDPKDRMRVREIENFADEAMLIGSIPLDLDAVLEPARKARCCQIWSEGRELLRIARSAVYRTGARPSRRGRIRCAENSRSPTCHSWRSRWCSTSTR